MADVSALIGVPPFVVGTEFDHLVDAQVQQGCLCPGRRLGAEVAQERVVRHRGTTSQRAADASWKLLSVTKMVVRSVTVGEYPASVPWCRCTCRRPRDVRGADIPGFTSVATARFRFPDTFHGLCR